jgi:NADP-dependent 3-hydroxy acid dehydrogenase YdfG
MQDVTGKVAFITGGASGMGLAMARSFCAAGMKVAIADIQQDALDSVRAEFARSNAEIITLQADVTDRDSMEDAARRTEAAFDKIHVVCNNAGVAVGGPLDAMDYKDWDWVVGVNLAGVINGVQTFVRRIEAHGEGGHIVNTASMAGHLAIPGLGVYNTTKFAVVGLSETLRVDLAAKNIGVSVLCPGVVSTNIFNSGRNRPDVLKGDVDNSALVLMTDVPEAERAARLAELVGNALDPAVVGDMVLAAIQANDPYIFTHPDLQPMVDARSAAMAESFARWARYRKEHGVGNGSTVRPL